MITEDEKQAVRENMLTDLGILEEPLNKTIDALATEEVTEEPLEYRRLFIHPHQSANTDPMFYGRWFCDIKTLLGIGLARTCCFKRKGNAIREAKKIIDRRRREWKVNP